MFLFSLVLLVCGFSNAQENKCSQSLSALEDELYATGDNLRNLSKLFYSPRKQSPREATIIYKFLADDDYDECSVTYLWSIGGFLFIQSPMIFTYSSLLFSIPSGSNDMVEVTLTLPSECRALVLYNTSQKCSCAQRNNLDLVTQQIRQYSKFNIREQINREETSTVHSVCSENLEEEYYGQDQIRHYFRIAIVMPIIAMIIIGIFVRSYHDQIKQKFMHSVSTHSLVSIVLIGLIFAVYVLLMDILAVFSSHNNYDYEPYNISKNYLNFVILIVTLFYDIFVGLYILFFLIIHLYLYLRNNNSPENFIYMSHIPYFFTLLLRHKENKEIGEQWSLWLLSSLLYCPLFMLCSHLGYIFIAFLTQPSRSTSVAILILAFFALLFLFFRSLHKIYHDIFTNADKEDKKDLVVMIVMIFFPLLFILSPFLHCLFLIVSYTDRSKSWLNSLLMDSKSSEDNDENENKEKQVKTDLCAILLTLIWGLMLGFGSIALLLSSFFLVPIPTTSLANYLENIVQIFLVFLAALISYKIISADDSELKKFLITFKQAYKQEVNVDILKKEAQKGQSMKAHITDLQVTFESTSIHMKKEERKILVTVPASMTNLKLHLHGVTLMIPVIHCNLILSKDLPSINGDCVDFDLSSAMLIASHNTNVYKIKIEADKFSISHQDSRPVTALTAITIANTFGSNLISKEITPTESKLVVKENGIKFSDFEFNLSSKQKEVSLEIPVPGTHQGFPSFIALDYKNKGMMLLPSSGITLKVKNSKICLISVDTSTRVETTHQTEDLHENDEHSFSLSLYIQYNNQLLLVTKPRALISLPKYQDFVTTSSSLKITLKKKKKKFSKEKNFLSVKFSHGTREYYIDQPTVISMTMKANVDSTITEDDELKIAGEIAAKVAYKLSS